MNTWLRNLDRCLFFFSLCFLWADKGKGADGEDKAK